MSVRQIIGQQFSVECKGEIRFCDGPGLPDLMREMGAVPAEPAGVQRWASLVETDEHASRSLTLADGSVLRAVEFPFESAVARLAGALDRDPTLFWHAIKASRIAGPRANPHYGCRMALAFNLSAVSVHRGPFVYGEPERWFWVVYSPTHQLGEPQEVVAKGSESDPAIAWDAADAAALIAGWKLA